MTLLKVLLIFLVLLQAWEPALAQTAAPGAPEAPGILQRLADRAGRAKTKMQVVGKTVLDFTGAYYEDHIQPVAESYAEWASDMRNSLWEKIQATYDNYSPFTKNSSSTDA